MAQDRLKKMQEDPVSYEFFKFVVNHRIGPTKFTNLMYASENAWVDQIKLYLLTGANINDQDTEGKTALIFAVIKNQIESVKELVKQKDINLELYDKHYLTALMYACFFGYKEVAQILIEHNANYNYIDDEGYTPFLSIVMRGHINMLDMFIEKGVDIHKKINTGQNAISLASTNGHIEMVEKLIKLGVKVETNCDLLYNVIVSHDRKKSEKS